jgi:hypothetical protein
MEGGKGGNTHMVVAVVVVVGASVDASVSV